MRINPAVKGAFGLRLYDAEINRGSLLLYGAGFGMKLPLVPALAEYIINLDISNDPSMVSLLVTGAGIYAFADLFCQIGKGVHNSYSSPDKMCEVEGLAGLIYHHFKK